MLSPAYSEHATPFAWRFGRAESYVAMSRASSILSRSAQRACTKPLREACRCCERPIGAGNIGLGQTTITVVAKQPEVEHKVRMRDFEAWLESNGRLPAEMALKSRLHPSSQPTPHRLCNCQSPSVVKSACP